MNKLYAFFALVFLTACGSPGLDGTWSGVGESKGLLLEITGDEAKYSDEGYYDDPFLCTVKTPGKSSSTFTCEESGLSFDFTASVDGDTMTVTEEDEDEILNFVRKQ